MNNSKIYYMNKWMTYEEAKSFIRSLNIQSKDELVKYLRSNNKPSNLPKSPRNVYKQQWKGFIDFLGVDNRGSKTPKINWMSYEEAKAYVNKIGIKNTKEWREFYKTDKRPYNLPASPGRTYKDKGWVSFKVFFDTDFLTYEEAKEYVHSLNINSVNEWTIYCKSKDKHKKIPSAPDNVYKEWISWADFLGTSNYANLTYRSYREVKEYARDNNVKSKDEWIALQKPLDIPNSVNIVYKDEWEGWNVFLDTEGLRYKSEYRLQQIIKEHPLVNNISCNTKVDLLDNIIYLGKYTYFKPDIYIHDYNINIEYHGQQHYKPVAFGSTKSDALARFHMQIERDKLRRSICNERGIQLIEISYDDPNKFNKEYIHGLIDNAIHRNSAKVF